ncbi:hypothetical protein BGZ99_010352 [Dissophora globulifera]|uniref:FAD-binding domain-containing protein n=1 Tax=Dissophora globulifera TaxID=979702 RepID=A0A9P6UL27_9FUNG|nr:hypothetical protein BGZ99_010352 [Dissophora globulifera]
MPPDAVSTTTQQLLSTMRTSSPTSTPSPCYASSTPSRPHVLIVGGGIGGLTLAILLERAEIPYTVLERSTHIRPLGSAIALGPGVLPLFEQLGLLDEIEQQARPVTRGMVWSEKLVPIMDLDHTTTQKRVIARPKLYQILLSHVPKRKLRMGKKVVSFAQSPPLSPYTQQDLSKQPPIPVQRQLFRQQPIVLTCEDGTHFSGDILVGADGAYSVTRHLLYQQIENDYATAKETVLTWQNSEEIPTRFLRFEPLPDSDKEPLSFTSTCLVGQTEPSLDLKTFKNANGSDCKVGSVIGDNKPYSWSVFSMPDDSVCWMVTEHLKGTFSSSATPSISPSTPYPRTAAARSASPALFSLSYSLKHDTASESSSEWGPDRVDVMCEQVRDFPVPCGPGLKMNDLIQQTSRDKISKVMLEEKLFETWFYGRVVLLGDACHKMHPSAGLGAVAAIQDAAVLSDLLYHLPTDPSLKDITMAFEAYRQDRYPIAQQSYETSYQMSHLNEQSWISNFIRRVMNNLPKWIWYRVLDRMYEYRPQVSFLPRVGDRGEVPPMPPSYNAGLNKLGINLYPSIDMDIDP